MTPLAPGTYSITNVKYRNVAVLPNDNRDSDIVGRPDENSLRGKWDVSRLGNGRYAIQNQALPHFARSVHDAGEGDNVYGGKRAQHLIIKESRFRGRYTIAPADATDLFWGLPDGEAGTPIALANVATDPKNHWMFIDMLQPLPNSVHTQSQGQLVTTYEIPPASLSFNASQLGATRINSPAPHHVYNRNLILKGIGCPLYIPEPSGNSPLYRTKGVRIGDVGFVTDDGYFKTLFNLRASVLDPINMRCVPDGFEQIDLHEDDIEVVPDYFDSGTIIASVTATSGVLGPDPSLTTGPSAVSSGHRLIWNTSEGAVLHLPNGSTRIRCDSELFRDQATRNGYNWYKYAWQTRRCGVRNGALCLVTGTDKANTWMLGAFSQTPPGNQVFLSIWTNNGGAVDENFPCSYSWVGTNPAMRRSKGRPVTSDRTVDLADMERDDAVFRSDAPGGLTHCVFVRGFRISLRKSLWAYLSRSPLLAELSLIQDSAPEDFTSNQDRGHSPGAFSSVFFTQLRGGDNPGGEGQPRTFISEGRPQQLGLANEATTALPVDPAATVNDLLLNLVPEAQVAVIHDDEWHSLLQEDDADFPDSSKLVARLNRKYMLDVRTGSVSLRPAGASLRRRSSKSSFPFRSCVSPYDQGSSRGVDDDLELDPLATPMLLGDESRKMSTSMAEPFDLTVTDHAEASNFEIEHSTRLKSYDQGSTNSLSPPKMDIIEHCLSLAPVPYLRTAFSIFRIIYPTIRHITICKRQLQALTSSIAELLNTLDNQYRTGEIGEANTSLALQDLESQLREIADFTTTHSVRGFLHALFFKEQRIATIEDYHRRLTIAVSSFQISASLDIQSWQSRNDEAREDDQRNLDLQLSQLEANQVKLMATLNVSQRNMKAVMASLQRYLDQRPARDRERQFYSHSLECLYIFSGSVVKLEKWTITPFEVEFGPEIGSGGFGTVFKGTWNKTTVALKVLKTNGVPLSTSTMRNEIEIWSTLSHPNIIQFCGANVLDDKPFIVMPYFKNGNARDYLLSHKDCDRLKILYHVSLGVIFLHSKKIVHGDLKALNILLDDGLNAVLSDFGISRIMSDISTLGTATGITGTPNWMAPERMRGGPLKRPCDIYSFGMTAYEIYANETPLSQLNFENFFELVARNGVRPERPDHEDAPELSDDIWNLVVKCWAQDPATRPSATAVCDIITQLRPSFVSQVRPTQPLVLPNIPTSNPSIASPPKKTLHSSPKSGRVLSIFKNLFSSKNTALSTATPTEPTQMQPS